MARKAYYDEQGRKLNPRQVRRLVGRRGASSAYILGLTSEAEYRENYDRPQTLAQEELKKTTKVTDEQGKEYTGKVVDTPAIKESFVGVREVTPQEQQQNRLKDVQARAQYNLRKPELKDMSYSEFKERKDNPNQPDDYYTQKYGTETQRRELLAKRYIQTTPEQRYIRAATGANIEYKAVKNTEQYDDGSILVERRYGERMQALAEREKYIDDLKNNLYAKGGLFTPRGMSEEYYKQVSILPDKSDNKVVEFLKGINRIPYELAYLPFYTYSRGFAYADTVFHQPEQISLTNPEVRKKTLDNFKYTFDVKNNPDATANIALSLLAIKGEAANPPKFIKQTYKPFVPYEKAGFKIIEGVGEKRTLPQLLNLGEKSIKTGFGRSVWEFSDLTKREPRYKGKGTIESTHATYADIFKKSLISEIKEYGKPKTSPVIAFPEKASGFRAEIGEYSLYSLPPEKATGQTIAAGSFIGLGQTQSSSKITFSLSNPSRYVNIFQNEQVSSLVNAERVGMRQGLAGDYGQKVKAGRSIVKAQSSLKNTVRLAPENLVGQSSESQVIRPVGSIMQLESQYFTQYQKPSPFTNTIITQLWQKFAPKYDIDVNIVKMQGSSAESPKSSFSGDILKSLDASLLSNELSSYGSRRVSIKPTPLISSTGKSTSSINSGFKLVYSSVGNYRSSGSSFVASSSGILSSSKSSSRSSYTFSSSGFKSLYSSSSLSRSSGSYGFTSSGSYGSSSTSSTSSGSSSRSSYSIIKTPQSRQTTETPRLIFLSKTTGTNLFNKRKTFLSSEKRYTPTFYAQFTGLTASKKSLIGEKTGLGLRPIII